MRLMLTAALGAASFLAAPATAQPARPPPAALIAAQQQAMRPLSWLQGRFQGEAWSLEGDQRHDFIQTERVGPMLDGSVLVLEGRAFERDGRPAAFNAFAVVSYDTRTRAYELRSYAWGRAGTFPLEVTTDGFVWTAPAGPGATIRYTATRTEQGWREVGELISEGRPATQIFESNLRRVGDTDWPAAGGWTAPRP